MKSLLYPPALVLSASLSAQSLGVEPTLDTSISVLSPFAELILNEHNRVRQAEQAGLYPMSWSSELAGFAQAWADRLKQQNSCGMQHRSGQQRYLNGRITGENLFQGTSSRAYTGYMWSPSAVVQSWASEKPYYSFASRSCRSGYLCGHYTQIVWRSTTQLGCGRAQCGNKEVWVCNYLPAGNYVGQNPY